MQKLNIVQLFLNIGHSLMILVVGSKIFSLILSLYTSWESNDAIVKIPIVPTDLMS